MKLTLLASLLALSCNTVSVPAPVDLDLTTDGGLTGRGLGSVSIRGDAITARTLGPQSCSGTVTATERNELAAAVEPALHEEWRSDYTPAGNPHGSADQIRYALTLNGRRVTWTDEAETSLPPALATLRKIAWQLRDRTCRQ